MCAFGMYQDTEDGRKLAMKPTGFMTNASEIADELKQTCDGQHTHVKLLNGRARRAEVYPDELCYHIVKGLMKQMKKDGRMSEGQIGIVAAEEIMAWDDTTGEELDPQMVKVARDEEMEEVKKHTVYKKVPIKMCWD